MTHVHDPAQTLRYFSACAELYDSYANEQNLYSRDRLLLEKVIPPLNASELRIVDYGCGAGHLTRVLADKGHRVIGIEPNPELQKRASGRLTGLDAERVRVELGGVGVLSALPAASVDMFVAMGVFQYLSDSEYAETLEAVRRILRPGGHMVATYQNALFDLTTFNRYTLDFYEHQLLAPLAAEGLDVPAAVGAMRKLMTNAERPVHDASRARDNIFVRLSNPLTIGAELKAFGMELADLHFYAFQPVPPLIAKDLGEDVKRVAAALDVEHSQEWFGYLLGSAFLTHCITR